MFWQDDYDDLFDILKDMFPNSREYSDSKHINYRESERIISDDNVFYTLNLIDVEDKGDIKVYNDEYNILITLQDKLNSENEEVINLISPRRLIKDKIDWTYKNDLLDIISYINTEEDKE